MFALARCAHFLTHASRFCSNFFGRFNVNFDDSMHPSAIESIEIVTQLRKFVRNDKKSWI